MPYPMVRKDVRERYEKWIKSVEDKIGLPWGLFKRLDIFHKTFYLQNMDKMTVKQSGDEIFFFVFDNKLKKDIYKLAC